jgi:hypothetical protein
MSIRFLIVLAILSAFAVSGSAQFEDPQAGVWKLNAQKSSGTAAAVKGVTLRVSPNELWRKNGKVVRAAPDSQVGTLHDADWAARHGIRGTGNEWGWLEVAL